MNTVKVLQELPLSSKRELSREWLKIAPTFPMEGESEFLSLEGVQKMVEALLPEEFWEELSHAPPTFSWYYRLLKSLPLFYTSSLEGAPSSLSLIYLCPAEYTHGVGRYVIDTLSRWLVPGKQSAIVSSLTLNFFFEKCPPLKFYIGLKVLSVQKEELEIIQTSLPSLVAEMKMNIMAVYHARSIASVRSVSLEYKQQIIQENLSSLLNLPSHEAERSLYDQMHGFLLTLSAEEKLDQVKKNIAHLQQSRPKAFDRDVFYEMTHFTDLFQHQFSSKRDPRHISRVVALHYLFKKGLIASQERAPGERHLSLKIFKTLLHSSEPALGLLVGLNLLRETEPFDKRQLVAAIQNALPHLIPLDEAFIADRRDEKLRFFYLEVEKEGRLPFKKEEIQLLKERLPEEIKKQLDNAVHPIFMPRNEEELFRNLLSLSKQLKYVKDRPQVSIHYERQNAAEISFLALVAKIRKKKERSLKDTSPYSRADVSLSVEETRSLGTLRKVHQKEGAVLKITLKKAPFFRRDRSVDLLKARQRVTLELAHFLGEFRDFNGGMILKQDEAFHHLSETLHPSSEQELFFLETYFYSLRPAVMQTLHEPSLLLSHFRLLLKLLERGKKEKGLLFEASREGKFSLFFFALPSSQLKEVASRAIEPLQIASYDLTTALLQLQGTTLLGYLLKCDTEPEGIEFEKTLLHALQKR